jgi:hypothetical protein
METSSKKLCVRSRSRGSICANLSAADGATQAL